MTRLATTKYGKLRQFHSVMAVAKALDVHEDTILRMIKRGEITAIRLRSKTLRVPADDLERLLQRQREGREWKPETCNQFIPQ